MENILPIIFLILYLVINTVVKRRKASQGSPAAPRTGRPQKKQVSLTEILQTLAEDRNIIEKEPAAPSQKDWFGIQSEPVDLEEEIVKEEQVIYREPEAMVDPVEEGIPSVDEHITVSDEDPYARPEDSPYERPEDSPYERPDPEVYVRPVEQPYRETRAGSVLELINEMPLLRKGILLNEILGPPRALQDPKSWFGRSGK